MIKLTRWSLNESEPRLNEISSTKIRFEWSQTLDNLLKIWYISYDILSRDNLAWSESAYLESWHLCFLFETTQTCFSLPFSLNAPSSDSPNSIPTLFSSIECVCKSESCSSWMTGFANQSWSWERRVKVGKKGELTAQGGSSVISRFNKLKRESGRTYRITIDIISTTPFLRLNPFL